MAIIGDPTGKKRRLDHNNSIDFDLRSRDIGCVIIQGIQKGTFEKIL